MQLDARTKINRLRFLIRPSSAENRQNSARVFVVFINGETHCCHWQRGILAIIDALLVPEKKRGYLLLAGNGKNLGFRFSTSLCLVSFLRSLFVTRNGISFVPFSPDEEKLFLFELDFWTFLERGRIYMKIRETLFTFRLLLILARF